MHTETREKVSKQARRGSIGPLFFQIGMVGLDVICLTGLYTLFLMLRFSENFQPYFNPFVFSVLVPFTILTHAIVGGYDRSTDMCGLRYASEHFIGAIANLLFVLVLIYFLTGINTARANVGIILIVFPIVSLLYRRLIYAQTRKTLHKRPLYIIGSGPEATDFYKLLKQKDWPQALTFFDLNGQFVGRKILPEDADSPVLRGDFMEALEEAEVDTIVIADNPENIPRSILNDLVSIHFMRVQVLTLYTFFATYWKMVPVSQVSPYWAFEEGFRLNLSLTYDRMKRFFDIVFAAVALLILWPLMLIIAVIIKLDSSGPAIFRQTRVGRNEQLFTLLKFRTMAEGSDREDLYTRTEDSRITRVGKLLRKSRLDELPQLWNVLWGDMSLIGPRAEWIKIVRNYEKTIPHYHFRHLVKPGITGWAQVNYPYGESDLDAIEKLKYDLYYVRHYSLLLDMSICLKTIYVILFGKGQ